LQEKHDTTAVFHPEEQQRKIGAADQYGMRIEPSIQNGYTRRAINWQEDLETTVEYLPRPRQQGLSLGGSLVLAYSGRNDSIFHWPRHQMLPRLCDVAELGIPKTELIVGRHPCWWIVQHWKICLDGLLEVSLACLSSRQQVIGSIKLSSYFVACSQCLMASSVRPSFW